MTPLPPEVRRLLGEVSDAEIARRHHIGRRRLRAWREVLGIDASWSRAPTLARRRELVELLRQRPVTSREIADLFDLSTRSARRALAEVADFDAETDTWRP